MAPAEERQPQNNYYQEPVHCIPTPVGEEHSYDFEDDGGLRTGVGTILWKRNDWFQTYEGEMLKDCMHGMGTYTWNFNGEKCTYEGYFNINKMEGYGRCSFPNGGLFEGLYKDNKRFGPGMLTYPDGTEDVGLWVDKKLIMLTQQLDAVPRLSSSKVGKEILSSYLTVLEIKQPTSNVVHNLEDRSSNSEDQNVVDYCALVRDPRSCFFNKELFEDAICNTELLLEDSSSLLMSKLTLPSVLSKISETQETQTSQGSQSEKNLSGRIPGVKFSETTYFAKTESELLLMQSMDETIELLAWNNSEQMIEIEEFSYQHYPFINSLEFSINQRHKFRRPGDHEVDCVQMLESCRDGIAANVRMLLLHRGVHPDIMDSYGNTGLMIAAIHNKPEIINILLDFGADVNHWNDECLNTLNICILQYIADNHNIFNWEEAFLYNKTPPINKGTAHVWRPFQYSGERERHDSVESAVSFNLRIQEYRMSAGSIYEEKLPEDDDDLKVKKECFILLPSHEKLVVQPESSNHLPAKEIPAAEWTYLIETISLLLVRGADPNLCPVPFSSLMLAVYSRSITLVDILLSHGADPNAITDPDDGGLTALHTLTMLPACDIFAGMCKILLLHGADPNIETQAVDEIATDEEAVNEIAADLNQDEAGKDNNENKNTSENFVEISSIDDNPEGKIQAPNELMKGGRTALHTLCMRPSMEEDKKSLRVMCMVLLQNSEANPNALYRGHTPLSLAIKQDDLNLVKILLSSGKVDPNQQLGPAFGVPLTMILSDECQLSLDSKINMMNLLLEYGADPLKKVTISDNFAGTVIEYGYFILDQKSLAVKSEDIKKNKTDKKSKKMKGKKEKEDEKSRDKSKKDKKSSNKSNDKRKKKQPLPENKTEARDLGILENLILENKKRILRHIQGTYARALMDLQKNIEGQMQVWSSDGIPMDTQETIDMVVKWMNPGDFMRCMSIFKNVNQLTVEETQPVELLRFLSGHVNANVEEEIEKLLKSSYDESNLWMTLETLDKSGMESQESVAKKEMILPMPQKKKKKKKGVLKKKKTETVESSESSSLQTDTEPQYQWGISVGKSEKLMKGPETIIIKNLKKSLKCLLPFQYTLNNSPISIVFSPLSTLPEIDTNNENYKCCIKCGRSQVELKVCPVCKQIALCPDDANTIDEAHCCELVLPRTQGIELSELWSASQDEKKKEVDIGFQEETSKREASRGSGEQDHNGSERGQDQRLSEIKMPEEHGKQAHDRSEKGQEQRLSETKTSEEHGKQAHARSKKETKHKGERIKSEMTIDAGDATGNLDAKTDRKVGKKHSDEKTIQKERKDREKLKNESISETALKTDQENKKGRRTHTTQEKISTDKRSNIKQEESRTPKEKIVHPPDTGLTLSSQQMQEIGLKLHESKEILKNKVMSEVIMRMSGNKLRPRKPNKFDIDTKDIQENIKKLLQPMKEREKKSNSKDIDDQRLSKSFKRELKYKRNATPENDHEYLLSICRDSMTHFQSKAQLLPNAFMAEGDMFYKLYATSPIINLNHSLV